jgi:hypothetical protein
MTHTQKHITPFLAIYSKHTHIHKKDIPLPLSTSTRLNTHHVIITQGINTKSRKEDMLSLCNYTNKNTSTGGNIRTNVSNTYVNIF